MNEVYPHRSVSEKVTTKNNDNKVKKHSKLEKINLKAIKKTQSVINITQ